MTSSEDTTQLIPRAALRNKNTRQQDQLDPWSYHVPGTNSKLHREESESESDGNTNTQSYSTQNYSREDRSLHQSMSYPPQRPPFEQQQQQQSSLSGGSYDPERGGASASVSFAGLPSSGGSAKVRQQGEYLELGGPGPGGYAHANQSDLRLPDGEVPTTKVRIPMMPVKGGT